jgi:hypothetical protein
MLATETKKCIKLMKILEYVDLHYYKTSSYK